MLLNNQRPEIDDLSLEISEPKAVRRSSKAKIEADIRAHNIQK